MLLAQYKYSESEFKKLLQSIVIISDTREQKNQHILEFFTKEKIKYIEKKLDFGDYSYFLPKSEELDIPRDIDFSNKFAIERKACLEELSGNLTTERARFESELIKGSKAKMILLIENSTYDQIGKHEYKTQYSNKSFEASLLTFFYRYNLSMFFSPDINQTGILIRDFCKYHLRECFK